MTVMVIPSAGPCVENCYPPVMRHHETGGLPSLRGAMRRSAQIGATLVAVLAMGGCADLRTALHGGAAVEATGTVQPRRGESTVLIYHPRMGFVRGTRSA